MLLPDILAGIGLPISAQLRCLRALSYILPTKPVLLEWGCRHLNLTPDDERRWIRRVTWGLMAGEAVRLQLKNEKRRAATLDLVDYRGWEDVAAAQANGGVILAAAHIGPPKLAMHAMMARGLPLHVWTRFSPEDVPDLPGVTLFDPVKLDGRSRILLNSAIHLRNGGMLFAAPDGSMGEHLITLKRLGKKWRFARGVPALARSLNVPVFIAVALWCGDRIRMTFTPLPAPHGASSTEEWEQKWIENYWRAIEPTILGSPENLRFLRFINWANWKREQGL